MGCQNRSRGSENGGFLEDHLTHHHGVRFSQLRSDSIVLFLSGEQGGLRGLEVALKLTVLLSCLGVTVLGRPPLLEETPSVVTVVRVGGVQR